MIQIKQVVLWCLLVLVLFIATLLFIELLRTQEYPVFAPQERMRFTWIAPPDSDVAFYNLYMGTTVTPTLIFKVAAKKYGQSDTAMFLANMGKGLWTAHMTAVDTASNESVSSNAVLFRISGNPPRNLRVTKP